MEPTPSVKISVSLALESLVEASNEVQRLEVLLAEARASRDRLLIDAYGLVPITRLARLAGLSRERVSKIASGKTRD
jgi:hypothetical protein